MLQNCGAVVALSKDRRDPQAVGLESSAAVSSSLGLVLERVRTGSFQKTFYHNFKKKSGGWMGSAMRKSCLGLFFQPDAREQSHSQPHPRILLAECLHTGLTMDKMGQTLNCFRGLSSEMELLERPAVYVMCL
ncbi:hypothetical protein mRhiFer1_009873 [Rhinolophus ferrumequinum]|uniref:Uncharacterized protein n=1 Tax=Rhinolophus ferrumequinum TaxID=59479 RepID=A0A7J7YSE6_RHIFE|nr:hypothetical protein mRhiFer1_009873 [Rhinolophus ferrumequinum]